MSKETPSADPVTIESITAQIDDINRKANRLIEGLIEQRNVLQDLLRLARQYVLGHYTERQDDAEAREALIQAIDEAAPPPEPYVGCDIGKYCAQRKGHTGECDDLPF